MPEGREALVIDLARQRFARGATQMRVREQIIARELSIRVADLQAALALIKSAGLPFSFAFSQSEAPQEDPVRSAE